MNKRRRNTALVTALALGLILSVSAYADMDAARKALSNNDYDTAVQQLDKVLDDNPDDAEAQFLKGLALARGGKTEAALADFRKLTNAHPKMAEAWNNRGVLEARKGNLDAARNALRQAVKLNPSHGPAQENLGDIYVALARNAYSRAGRLEKDNSIARSKSRQLASFIDSAGGLGAAGQASAQNEKAGSNAAAVARANAGKQSKTNAGNPNKNAGNTAGDTQPSKNAKTKVDISTPQAAVQSWARAWSAQDVDAYLSTYSDRFKPPDDESRSQWAASRRKHVNQPEHIDLSLSNAHVQRRGRQALVTFDQRYQSDSYHDRERKGLLLGKSDAGWKILREGKADGVHFLASAGASQNTPSENTESGHNSHNAGNGSAPGQSQKPNAGSGSGQSAPAGSNGGAPVQKQVRAALHHWAQAWSNENVQAYLDAYSNNFQPADGKSLSDWVRNRRQHVSRPKWIKVKLSDIKIEPQGNDRVEVSFDQRYRSNSYHDKERKQMTLIRENGDWRILKES